MASGLMFGMPNVAAQWRAAKDIQMQPDALSARPLPQLGSATLPCLYLFAKLAYGINNRFTAPAFVTASLSREMVNPCTLPSASPTFP